MSLLEPAAVASAIAEAGRHLPPQPPIPRFIHFISLQGDLPAGFEAAVRTARTRRGVRGWPDPARGRQALRAGRISPDDLDAALRDRDPDALALPLAHVGAHVITVGDVRRAALRADLRPIAPETLRDRLLGRATQQVAADLSPDAASRLLRGRPPASVLEPLWRTLLGMSGCTGGDPRDLDDVIEVVPSTPMATRRERRSAAEALRAELASGGTSAPIGRAWSRVVDVDVVAEVDAALSRALARFVDEGVAQWVPAGREDGLWPWLRSTLAQGAPLAADEEGRRALLELPGAPLLAVAAALRALGLHVDEAPAAIAQEIMALQGWSAMAAWYGARPDDPKQRDRPLDLVHLTAARFGLTLAIVGTAARRLGLDARRDALLRRLDDSPDELLARAALRAGSLPDDLARDVHDAIARATPAADPTWTRLAHGLWTRRAQGRSEAQARAAGTVWPLFHLAQHLSLDADAVLALGTAGVAALAEALASFDEDTRGAVWLDAFERAFRDEAASAIAGLRPHVFPLPKRPRAQVATCIDDREESLRRHLEELEPGIETLSIAGFFNVTMLYRGLDDTGASARCPVVLTPVHLVREEARPGAVRAQVSFAGRVLSLLGVAAPHGMASRLVFTADAERADRSPTRPQEGFTDAEQVDIVHSALLGLGILHPARLVVLLGHSGSSTNNPYAASYGCGACAGNPGGPNARLFAAMANRAVVRHGLGDRGIEIPHDTWFLGAEHDTTTDRVRWFDLEDLPATHEADVEALRRTFDAACGRTAQERCRRLPLAPDASDAAEALAHVAWRAVDPRQPRPELGHTNNALAVIGRRALTRGLFLDRRAFLVSYDANVDPDGSVLEATLMAAGPVGAQINLDYFFSSTDRQGLGAGSKAGQNLVAGVGLLQGAEGDLRTGLPWQMIEQHEPMRLLLMIEAPLERIAGVRDRRPVIRDLVDGAWVHLIAVDPDTGRMHRFVPGRGFEPYSPPDRPLPVWPSSADGTAGRREALPPARILAEPGGADAR